MIESYIIIIGMVVDPQVVAPTVLEHLFVFVQGVERGLPIPQP